MKKYLFAVFCVISYAQSANAQPPNDDPCGAIPLTLGSGSVCTPSNPYSWTGATASAGFTDPGCANYATGDIWFQFVAPASGNVYITTAEGTGPSAITDGGMAVYGNPAGCVSPTYFFVNCDDDTGPDLMPAMSLSLSPGVTYYIRFWDYNGATSGNIGGICVTDRNPPLATTGAVGIGIQNPDNLLDVNGVIKIRGGNPGINKVLTSDVDGGASWASLPGAFNSVPFKGTNTSDFLVASGITNIVSFNTEEYDPDANFSSPTFTVPADGIYHFDATVFWSLTGVAGVSNLSLLLYVSGSAVHAVDVKIPAFTSGTYAQTISADISLSQFQTVNIGVYHTTGINQTILGNGLINPTYFDGHRVK